VQKTALAIASETSSRVAEGISEHHGMSGGMMQTPFGPLPMGPAMAVAAAAKGATFLTSMREITFRLIAGNLSEVSEKIGGMAQ